jgi:hypothetical protein
MSEFPAPLVAADVDLSDFAFMPLDVQRLLTSETWVLGNAAEKVAALTLWLVSWHQTPAASLPDNDKMLAHLSQAGGAWKKVKDHALRGWVRCSDGRIYHPVVAEKANEAWEKKQKQRERSRKGNATRWANGTPQGSHKDPIRIPQGCDMESSNDPKGQGQGQGQGQLSKKDGGDCAGERDPIREALDAIGAWDDPNCRIHGARVPEWIRQGADLDIDILPTLRDVIAKARESEGPHWLPSSMNFFDKPISRAIARRTKPLPEGDLHHGETNQARSVGRAERIAAALAGVAPRTCPVDP